MRISPSIFSARLAQSFLLATSLATFTAAAPFELDAAARQKIESTAQRLIDEQHTPGIAIGIMSEGKIVYAQGFGLANLETGTKVTPDSVFAIGSNTKQFTAVAIMQLVEKGQLRLDDSLAKFFPDFPRADEVTLRHLLTHSSGIHPVMIPGGLPTPEQRVHLRTAADLVPIIQGQINLYDFDPGKGRKYSNSGYILLGVIIEKISGLSLGEFFQQNLFARAGMTASALDRASEVVPHRASGYNRAPGSNAYIHPPLLSDVSTGGGGIRSTLGDMLRWQDALLSGRIISLESVQAMTKPASDAGGPFGIMIGQQEGHTVFNTGGGGPGFRSTQKVFPDDRVAFVVLTNFGAPQIPNQSGSEPRLPPPATEQPPAEKKKRKSPQRNTGGAPNAVREMEQVLSEVILSRL